MTAVVFGGMVSQSTYTFATAVAFEVTLWAADARTGMVSSNKITSGSVRRIFSSLVFSTGRAHRPRPTLTSRRRTSLSSSPLPCHPPHLTYQRLKP